jgi:hypothetical protein
MPAQWEKLMRESYLVVDTKTGLVDGYWTHKTDAQESALRYQARIGNHMTVRTVTDRPYLENHQMIKYHLPQEN